MKKILLMITFFIFVGIFLSLAYFSNHESDKNSVKGITSPIGYTVPTLIPTFLPSSKPTVIPSPTTSLRKSTYSIAIFGDSMVDTMGEKLEYLQETLTKKYPQTKFNLYNYGIGGQNVEQGLARFESSFTNRERQFPPLPQLTPDILIIGSFAYNPFSTHDRNRHYSLLKELITKAKTLSSKVYLLVEIAPLKTGFGKGKNGINMPENVALEHANHIIEQLDDVINLSKAENIPLINVYYNSRINGSYGDPYFINQDDGIHPSAAGHLFTAELIVANIELD